MMVPEGAPGESSETVVSAAGEEPHGAFRTAWWQRLAREPASYELTRFAVLRLLAFVYLVAFVSLAAQLTPLFGSRGLLPAAQFLSQLHARFGGGAYVKVPTLFWWSASDATLQIACGLGVALSAAALAGITNAGVQLALWLLYASFVHVGQIFYGYGWEFQLLETGMLAVFMCPWRDVRPLPRTKTPVVTIWLLRWLIFRVMLGSGLIKLRGDPCWRELTCLDFHFETQPNPNPLSPLFHHAPHAVHVAGVLFNDLAEVVAPWFVFGFRRWRHVAGVIIVVFQVVLIFSGNLSFLNWLTIVPALACFDDSFFSRLLPRRWRAPIGERVATSPTARGLSVASIVYALVVAVLSVAPIANLISPEQQMNASFDPLDLVNTYGAFGSVDRQRFEVILEGTADPSPGPRSVWREYELPCMPGDPRRRPCLVSPYQHRLDWQMWFVGNGAARGEAIEDEPWLVHLVWQLLRGEPQEKRLLAGDPFPGPPPRAIRMGIWRYSFAARGQPGWWTRRRVGEFLPPVTLDHPGLREYVSAYRWLDAPPGSDPE